MKPIAGYLKKLNKIDKLVARLKKKKKRERKKIPITNIKNERP